MGCLCCCCKKTKQKHLEILEEIFKSYDTEKIRLANDKADRAARPNEDGPGEVLSKVQCVDIHVQQNKSNIVNFLKQTTDKIPPVAYYLRDSILVPSGMPEFPMLGLLLFKELIGIEFPSAGSSKKAYLFLKESEGTFLEAIDFLIQRVISLGDDLEQNTTIALSKTINTYTKLKKTENNFQKLTEIYDFLGKNIKATTIEIKVLSIEAVCNLILLMDTGTLMHYKSNLSNLMLSLLAEVYPMQIEKEEEGKIVIRETSIHDKVLGLKDQCMDTIARIVKKLDQSGNTEHGFLEPIIKSFREKGWRPYKLAGEIFVRIINSFEESQTLDLPSGSIKQIYATLLDYLSYSARNTDGREESVNIIIRMLKILRSISKCRALQTIGMYHQEKFVEAFVHLILFNVVEYDNKPEIKVKETYRLVLSNLYANPGVRLQIIEELIKFAHKELLYKCSENVLQEYLNYVLFTVDSMSSTGSSEEVMVPFPTESFKQLVDFIYTHMCLRTLLEIILKLLKTQNIALQFEELPNVLFNDDLVSDVYSVLMSVFKHVLKRTNLNISDLPAVELISPYHELWILSSGLELFKMAVINSDSINHMFYAVPFLRSFQLEFLEDIPNIEEANTNYYLFTELFGLMVGILSRKYESVELKDYRRNSLINYGLSLQTLEICTSEDILQNTEQFVGQVAANTKIDPVFVNIKRINERKEIYPIEPLINICAEFILSKTGGDLDEIKKVLRVNFVDAVAPEEATIRMFSISEGNVNALVSDTSREDNLMESEVMSNVEAVQNFTKRLQNGLYGRPSKRFDLSSARNNYKEEEVGQQNDHVASESGSIFNCSFRPDEILGIDEHRIKNYRV